jgi:UDP-N-acetylmuramate--alanine ligase
MSLETVARGLEGYRGVERRFQKRGEVAGVIVIDDYAHHPTEIKAVLAATRPGPWGRVIALFQPHRYSRTQAFYEEFGRSFSGADRIVITDIYGAGEAPLPGITGKLVCDAVAGNLPGRSIAYLPHRTEVLDYLAGNLRPGDLVLTLGAGDVTAYGDDLLGRLKEKA